MTLTNWHLVGFFVGLLSLLNSVYIYQIFGRSYKTYALRLGCFGFLELVSTILLAVFSSAYSIPILPVFSVKGLEDLSQNESLVFFLELLSLGFLLVLLILILLPQFLKVFIARARKTENRVSLASYSKLQARVYGGEAGEALELSAYLQLILQHRGVSALFSFATDRLNHLIQTEEIPRAKDNHIAEVLVELKAWEVLNLFPSLKSLALSRSELTNIFPFAVSLLKARIFCGDYQRAADELELIGGTKISAYWVEQLSSIESDTASLSESSVSEGLRRCRASFSQIRETASYVIPWQKAYWLNMYCLFLFFAWSFFCLQPQLTQTNWLMLLANKPFSAWQGFEVWRLFTHTFLHINFFHLLFNLIVIFYFAKSLNMTVGGLRAFQVILLGAFVGGGASAYFGDYSYGIGASTSAMAVYAFWLFSFFFYAISSAREWLSYIVFSALIVLGLQLFIDLSNPITDTAGHLGGFVAGVLYAVGCRMNAWGLRRRPSGSSQ